MAITLKHIRGNLKKFSFGLLLAAFVQGAYAVDPINTGFFSDVAIKGYDPVAYFTEKKPVEGDKKYAYSWMDASWYFSSDENRQLFISMPERYAPQYGGYCAWAVSQNKTASIDPSQFTIHNDKLYLNYNEKVNRTWTAKKEKFIVDANRHWPELTD